MAKPASRAKRPELPAGPRLSEISPMLLVRSSRPFDDPDFVYELKLDGYRLLAEWEGDSVSLKTRGGADATKWFPEVVASLRGHAGSRCIVDGEVCVLDEIGRSDFEQLHARARTRGRQPGQPDVVYCPFDVLVHKGLSLLTVPLIERKAQLARLFPAPFQRILPVTHVEGDGTWLYQQAAALKLEGIVAKRQSSPYVPGARSGDWIKIKRPGATPAQRFDRSQGR